MSSSHDYDHDEPFRFHSSGAGFGPRYEPAPPRSERSYDYGSANPHFAAPTGASSRATWNGPSISREKLAARKRSVLESIQAEADAAVAELERKQGFSRIERQRRRRSARPEGFDAKYMEREEAEEKEDEIEELCDILLEEYGVQVEPLPPGARAPIYGPTVRAAWPVTEEGVGHERERRSRMGRASEPVLESSEDEASKQDDEELVHRMSRGPSDRLKTQTSFRRTYHEYERPSIRVRRRHGGPDDDDSYEAPSRPRPKPRGPGPGPTFEAETVFPMGENEERERKRDWERDWGKEREEREREMMRDREKMKEREIRVESEMRRDDLEREMAKRQKAENEEEWEDMHERIYFTSRRPPYPPAPPRSYYVHRPHSEYEHRRAQSYGGPPPATSSSYDEGHRSRGEPRMPRRSEYLSSDSRSRPGPPPPANPDAYMHGGLHEDDAPAPGPIEVESEDDFVMKRSRERGNYRGSYK